MIYHLIIMNFRYETIEKAIIYLSEHFKEQPDLESIASSSNLSPAHFQRLFTEWAGISPKKFGQYLTITYAKSLLRESRQSLFDTAFNTGLSGTGRLHDLFISIEAMTPAEYKNGGKGLDIAYRYQQSQFGEFICGSTSIGICHLAFCSDRDQGLNVLQQIFPNALFYEDLTNTHLLLKNQLPPENRSDKPIILHLKGTPFQLKVWEALLKIESGQACTYSKLATDIGQEKAARAVGSAVGANPVAYLIPCHRVIRASGVIGDYHWGPTRKMAMIGWEAAQINALNEF